jgi:antitoxin YefM
MMDSVSVNKFRNNLKAVVERVVGDHAPIKVTRRAGEDFIVMSADDWEREQETLYVLQNDNLMQQIAASLDSHNRAGGIKPDKDQLDEIINL